MAAAVVGISLQAAAAHERVSNRVLASCVTATSLVPLVSIDIRISSLRT